MTLVIFAGAVIQSAAGSGMPLRARDYAEGFGAAETFNVRQPLVQLIQQGISTSSYPAQDRTGLSVFTQWGVNFAYNGR